LVIAGPSGVGKGTVIKQLQERHPGVFGFSVSHATRQPREGEVHGVHYNFVTVEDFERMIGQNNNAFFLEHAKVHGNYYGSSLAAIQAVAAKGQVCVLDIDCQGARSARKAGVQGTYVFLSPPSIEELERRLRDRGTETEEAIQRRMQTTRLEMAAAEEAYEHEHEHDHDHDGVGGGGGGDNDDDDISSSSSSRRRRRRRLFDEIICNDVLEHAVAKVERLMMPHIEAVRALQQRGDDDTTGMLGGNAKEKKKNKTNKNVEVGGGGGGSGRDGLSVTFEEFVPVAFSALKRLFLNEVHKVAQGQ
jgi:guanylate kinase